jgi:hypothetical protein
MTSLISTANGYPILNHAGVEAMFTAGNFLPIQFLSKTWRCGAFSSRFGWSFLLPIYRPLDATTVVATIGHARLIGQLDIGLLHD